MFSRLILRDCYAPLIEIQTKARMYLFSAVYENYSVIINISIKSLSSHSCYRESKKGGTQVVRIRAVNRIEDKGVEGRAKYSWSVLYAWLV